MSKELSKAQKNLYGTLLGNQANDNKIEIGYSTVREYEFIKGLKVETIDEFLENSKNANYHFYDFNIMISRYEEVFGEIPCIVFRCRKSLGVLAEIKAYPSAELEKVIVFNTVGRKPPIKEYISMLDFVCAIKGDEPFDKVRVKWYKRLSLVGVKRDIKRGLPYDLKDFQLRKIPDEKNTNKRNKAFFFNLEDLLNIKDYFDSMDELKLRIKIAKQRAKKLPV